MLSTRHKVIISLCATITLVGIALVVYLYQNGQIKIFGDTAKSVVKKKVLVKKQLKHENKAYPQTVSFTSETIGDPKALSFDQIDPVEKNNLPLLNGNFESGGQAPWAPWSLDWHGDDFAAVVQADNAHSSRYALRMTDNNTGQSIASLSQAIDLTAFQGKKMRFSAWVYWREGSTDPDKGAGQLQAGAPTLRVHDTNLNKYFRPPYEEQPTLEKNQWTKISVDFEVTPQSNRFTLMTNCAYPWYQKCDTDVDDLELEALSGQAPINLALNGNFDNGLNNWERWNQDGGNFTPEIDNSDIGKYNGRPSLKITDNDTAWENSISSFSQVVDVSRFRGEKLTFQAMIKWQAGTETLIEDNVTPRGVPYLRIVTPNKPDLKVAAPFKKPDLDKWEKTSLDYIVPDDASNIRVILSCAFHWGGECTGNFAEVQLLAPASRISYQLASNVDNFVKWYPDKGLFSSSPIDLTLAGLPAGTTEIKIKTSLTSWDPLYTPSLEEFTLAFQKAGVEPPSPPTTSPTTTSSGNQPAGGDTGTSGTTLAVQPSTDKQPTITKLVSTGASLWANIIIALLGSAIITLGLFYRKPKEPENES